MLHRFLSRLPLARLLAAALASVAILAWAAPADDLREAQKLYGQGKMVVRKTQKIKAGELLVLAGDDKNDTAWFVVLSQVEK